MATCLSRGRNSCRIRNPWIFFDFSIENQELLMRHGFRPLDRHVATSHSQDLFFRQTCVHHANPLCDFLCDTLVRPPWGLIFGNVDECKIFCKFASFCKTCKNARIGLRIPKPCEKHRRCVFPCVERSQRHCDRFKIEKYTKTPGARLA